MSAAYTIGDGCPAPGCTRRLEPLAWGRLACKNHGEPAPRAPTRPCPRGCGADLAETATRCARCGWALGGGVMSAGRAPVPEVERARLEPEIDAARGRVEQARGDLASALDVCEAKVGLLLDAARDYAGTASAASGREPEALLGEAVEPSTARAGVVGRRLVALSQQRLE